MGRLNTAAILPWNMKQLVLTLGERGRRAEEGRGGQRRAEEGRGGQRRAEEGRGGQRRAEEGRGGQRRGEEGRGGERRGEEGGGGERRGEGSLEARVQGSRSRVSGLGPCAGQVCGMICLKGWPCKKRRAALKACKVGVGKQES